MAGEETYKYRQIAGDLRARIRGGEHEPGGRLPSKSKLMERYSVSLGTLNDAYRILRNEGLIRTEQGSATFVCDPLPDEEQGLSPEFTKIMERLDGMEAELRRQIARIDELERRPRGQ